MTALPVRLHTCFEQRDFATLRELYAEDAVLEVHVGAAHDVHAGRDAVVGRYAEDFASPAVFLRWDVREAPWGAVVQAAAVQGGSMFRWVHVLAVEGGRIATDTVYCTGAITSPDTPPSGTDLALAGAQPAQTRGQPSGGLRSTS